ncbi:hypothetical protein BJ138DRAFT_1145716 [Hygrophoropsis aurantiaca]|uniref:Uncharacterized protein n=1 Tax=Hygrophoropsis aurantiaca TaxID=72124 RepID=A0ACB8ALN4_9AGAM|nr:hypothetical protein BJ138DRAFT_1145716 [Hygrophoropsis aurantiaca]
MNPTGSSLSSSPVKRTGDSSRRGGVATNVSSTRQENDGDVRNNWIGPMPVDKFMDKFMECKDLEPMGDVTNNGRPSLENGLQEAFMNVINTGDRFPGFKLVNSSSHVDKDNQAKLKPDVCVYRADHDACNKPTDFLNLDMFLEFKLSDGDDLFNDNATVYKAFRATGTKTKSERRGQIIGYAALTCARQHRQHLFSASITGKFARLLLWDRTGTIVSKRFNYCEQPGLLLDFFRRYSRMSPTARGHDLTVRLATPEEEAIALAALTEEGYADRIDPKYPTMMVGVYDEVSKATRSLLVGRPETQPSSVVGRATKAYIAVDPLNSTVVFLKDCWRVAFPDMEKEGDILRKLNQKEVRNIPQVLYAGDVGGIDLQRTKSFDLINESWRCGDEKVTPHTHYRQVVDVVGKNITSITSSKQLVQVIRDAFQAHKDAVEKCKILHRDVSTGNILITRNGRGILNDWDMSKPMDISGARQLGRTGTWLFMSTRILQDPDKVHEIQDDMESFIHVLIYVALIFTPHTIIGRYNLAALVHRLFYQEIRCDDGQYFGGDGKNSGFTNSVVPKTVVFACEPIQSLVKQLVRFCKDWLLYCEADKDDEGAETKPLDNIKFKDHQAMDDLLASVVALPDERWPEREEIKERKLYLKIGQPTILSEFEPKSSTKHALESTGDRERPNKRSKSTTLSTSHT